MKTVYTNNNITQSECNNIINLNNKIITPNRKNVLMLPYNTKTYFVKTIDRNKEVTNPRKELDPTLKVIKYLDNNQIYSPLFVKINTIRQLGNNDYYLMDYIKVGDLNKLLPLLSTNWKYTLLIQSLLSIYILNHKIKLYHNDLFYMDVIRNMMVDTTNQKTTLNIEMADDEIIIDIDKFCIKMIDFGRCSNRPEFRTIEYHNKYFPNMKYISELFLFTFVYLKSIGKENKINFDDIQKCDKIVSIKEFDDNFLLLMCEKFGDQIKN